MLLNIIFIMKKTKTIEVEMCDICEDDSSLFECLLCDKTVCYGCYEKHLKKFNSNFKYGDFKYICLYCLEEYSHGRGSGINREIFQCIMKIQCIKDEYEEYEKQLVIRQKDLMSELNKKFPKIFKI